ncbi:MAG: butyrate kinase [bacterium]
MAYQYRVLVINPGSTSTKVSLFEDYEQTLSETIRHSDNDLSGFPNITSQYEFREKIILDMLERNGIPVDSIHAVVGRGGLLHFLEGGTYAVNELMKKHLFEGVMGEHASNLGGLIASAIADEIGVPSFIVDPVVVDELEDIARLSGHPELPRKSIFHALNHKACARVAAEQIRKKYFDANLIVAHMGGGISIGAHKKGRVVDVNNALNGDGPYTPERSGGLPAGDLVKLCFSGKYSEGEIQKMIKGKGGLVAYLGTNDVREVLEMIDKGDEKAKLVLDGMCYQIAKEIGLLAAVLEGDVDAIVLSGGVAYSAYVIREISRRVEWIAEVIVVPGEAEMEALAGGGIRVLRGEETAREYIGKK